MSTPSLPPRKRRSRRPEAASSWWTPARLFSPREGHLVLRAFVNAFKIPDLRKKILFTVFIIAVFRFGSHLPAPDIDFQKLQEQFANNNQSVLQFIDLFSGGALTRFAVFSLGIMPYITSSI